MRFDDDAVQAQRQRAREAWAHAIPADTPEGWSVSPADPGAVVAAFGALRLAPGVMLRAHQFRAFSDGNAVVWALRGDEALPAPPADGARPPRPPQALADPMEAIEGDGTEWSYLSASLLARELGEFGAVGHGMSWSVDTVLCGDPWDRGYTPHYLGPVRGPSGSASEWTWAAPQPADWRPAVVREHGTVTVTFFTFSALGIERIIAHVDSYHEGRYVPRGTSRDLATGPAGFTF